ncbi:cystathionine beta-lyase family protein involved in aluminum resistance [Anaerobacterium chartisolvens]|uniref:Cystathionine beta-lyase family protein involved in aluminum resistance n=1 Tax=Anaerobacterium chartisolvens TaxID=1297424 RepID=A0A369B8F1_9FIRM|nr:methionine gamma-lyase family protein [Anaerobacterium chartisolvens]RCX16817.1 cystathionine beta-lyase family protein involved in aluminum resistance [Anaerobacterium chartisolvens]
MNFKSQAFLKNEFGIDESIIKLSNSSEKAIADVVGSIDSIREYNQFKVISAMQKNNVSETHFSGTTGYGYDDRGREILDLVYADVFKAEAALVRHQIVSGTQALAICMYGVLRPGDELLSVTGKPYDTLEEVIGLRGTGGGSLGEFGISYRQVDLLADGGMDFEGIKNAVGTNTRLVLIQRSKGYGWRPSLNISDIRKAVEYIKSIKKDAVILIDNCYGEFTEEMEPVEAGADLVAGSLIKNPGGGLAPTGGYVAGKKALVEKAAYRLTTPGLGKKVGSTLGHSRLLFQGLFMAPHTVAESLKGAVYCAALMEKLGFETSPAWDEKRGDIIQAIKFGNPDSLVAFCQGIQKGSAVDAFVTPQPWDMPGYDCPVIMAAGAFIQGSSIELSADAPMKPPYIAYMQGGLVYEHVKLGVLISLQMMLDRGIIKI